MKKLFSLMSLLVIIITGCNRNHKSPIEIRFEEYMRAENLVADFIEIDSIVSLDSVNIISHYEGLTNMKDSVHEKLMTEKKAMTENMGKLKSQDFASAISFAAKLPQVTDGTTEREIKEKISIFLEDIPESKAWYKKYKIVASFKDGQKNFYVNNIAFEDTMTISDNEIECGTRKFQRMMGYFTTYLTDVYAPQAVLLDEAKALHDKCR